MSLRDEVVRGRARERARVPERADETHHERRMSVMHLLPVEAEARRMRRREVVEDDVGPADEAGALGQSLVGLEVDDDRALPAVQRHEVAADLGPDRHHVPVAVPVRRLDLDDVRAEIGQQHPAERPRDVLRVLDHVNAFERQGHGRPSPLRPITSWRISAEPPEIVEPTDERYTPAIRPSSGALG